MVNKTFIKLYHGAVIFIMIAMTVYFPVRLAAKGSGETAFNFLKMSVGPRAVGMGEAFTAVADDASATYWNPAGLVQLDRFESSLAHTRWFENITYQNAAAVIPMGSQHAFGLSIYNLSKDNIQGYDARGSATGKLSFSDTAVAVSYAVSLPWFRSSAGITAEYVQEKIADRKTGSIVGALGLLSQFDSIGDIPFSVGIAVKNIGPAVTYSQESYALPLMLTGGLSTVFLHDALRVSLDYSVPNDNDAFIAGGFEYAGLPFIALRAGYRSELSREDSITDGIRVGIGLGTQDISIDYAYVPYGDYGDTHRFGVSTRFGLQHRTDQYQRKIYRHFIKAQAYYRVQDLLAAHEQTAMVLTLDPSHAEAAALQEKIVREINAAQLRISIIRIRKMIDKNKLVKAKALCEKIHSLQPDNPDIAVFMQTIEERLTQAKSRRADILYQQGEEFYEQEAFIDAIELWEKILLIDPDRSMVISRIQDAQEQLVQQEKEKNRLYADFLYKKAEKACDKKRWKRAEELLQEIIQKNSSHTKAQELLKSTRQRIAAKQRALSDQYLREGIMLLENNDIEQAHLLFKDAMEANPENKQAKKYQQETLTRLNAINRAQARETNKKGLVAYNQGALKKAMEYFEEAVRLYPSYEEAQKNLQRTSDELNR